MLPPMTYSKHNLFKGKGLFIFHEKNAFKFPFGIFRSVLSTIVLYCIVYLYSAQCLHVPQDQKRYLANQTAQVQPQLTRN